MTRDRKPDALAEIPRRIERARETQAAVALLRRDPSLENVAALHRLHAEHLREDDDPESAARAEARAKRAESRSRREIS